MPTYAWNRDDRFDEYSLKITFSGPELMAIDFGSIEAAKVRQNLEDSVHEVLCHIVDDRVARSECPEKSTGKKSKVPNSLEAWFREATASSSE